jgi:hypothetical protein
MHGNYTFEFSYFFIGFFKTALDEETTKTENL